MAYLSSSLLLCLLFITKAIANPVIFTNDVTGLRQQTPNQFLPPHFKDFPEVDYIFLPDLSQDFDAFDYESAPLDSTGNTFPSIEFNSKRSREEDEVKKIATQKIFIPNVISSNNKEKNGLREIHSQPSSSSFQHPSNVSESKPVDDEQARSDRLLSSIIGGIKKDIFNNQPVNNRIVQQSRNKDTVIPSTEFPAALQVSESISVPTKVSAPELHKNNFQAQPGASRSPDLLSMIVKGIQKDIFPTNDKHLKHSPPQSISGTQTLVQNSQVSKPVREDFIFEANPSIIPENTVLPGRLQQNPNKFGEVPEILKRVIQRQDHFQENSQQTSNLSRNRQQVSHFIPGTQTFVQNSQFNRPVKEDLVFQANPSIISEHRVLPGRSQQSPNHFEQVPEALQHAIQRQDHFQENSQQTSNLSRNRQQASQFIPGTQTFVQNSQFSKPVREDFIFEANPGIIAEHTVLPGRSQQSPNHFEQAPEALQHGIQRQDHFQENSQQTSNLSRNRQQVSQFIPETQAFVQNSQFFRPVREDLPFEANPSIISEHRILPGRSQQSPNHFEQVPETLHHAIQRQDHFQENRQQTSNFSRHRQQAINFPRSREQTSNPSRSQLLLENILSSIQRDIFNRQRFI